MKAVKPSKRKLTTERQKKISRLLWIILIFEVVVIAALLVYFYLILPRPKPITEAKITSTEVVKKEPEIKTGKILTEEPAKTYTAAEVQKLIVQTNRRFDNLSSFDVTKQVFAYTSSDGVKEDVPVYARVYLPSGPGKKPIYAFAPGTTGVGDSCAASLEDPAKRDWANYDSLMMAYASQGYAVVITDYEGMRDPNRIHHYMVGELEGKAMLDSIRALKNLKLTKDQIDSNTIFAAGYSQGGQAAYFADQLRDSYAAELNLLGAIGYGPVTSVEETLDDASNGANINWFGPYVLTSYADWYKRPYPVAKILLQRWATTYSQDAQRECVDRASQLWPNNIGANRSNQVYTPEFLGVASKLNIAADPNYLTFSEDLAKNVVGAAYTKRPKLINHGIHDNVVLVSQSQHGFERLCVKANTVTFKRYDTSPYAIQTYNPSGHVDHYQTMNASFKDTIAWMSTLAKGQPVVNNCKQ